MYKIILSAYACHPFKGSEPGVGWNWLKEIAKYNKIYLLFYAGQGQLEAVESEIREKNISNNIELYPINVPKIFRTRFYRLRYEIWQIKAFFVAKEIIKEKQIDLIHQVTIAAWWFTGYFHHFKKVKKIFGPILGGQKLPSHGKEYVTHKRYLYECLRNFIITLNFKLNIFYKYKIKKYDKIFCGNNETQKLFVNSGFMNTELFLTVGIDCINNNKLIKNKYSFDLLFVGNINETKNILFLIELMFELKHYSDMQLTIIGDGPKLEDYKSISDKYKLNNIRFIGSIPKNETERYYKNSHIFVFPSLREGAPTVLLEAMCYGLPVIAFKMNGADIMLDDDSGTLIPFCDKISALSSFKKEVLSYYFDSDKLIQKGKNAENRVKQFFIWQKRGVFMQSIYTNVLRHN